jgi:peptidoglycan hydrolase-like protein with peptidoglycan-binding domain
MRPMTPPVIRSRHKAATGVLTIAVTMALLASACSDDGNDNGNIATSGTESTATEAPQETEAPEDPVAAAEQRVTDAEDGVTEAQEGLTTAHGAFCESTTTYVTTLDRYGRIFIDRAATVGDINTLGADLEAPRDEVTSAAGDVNTAKDSLAAAQQELIDAQAALAAAIATASSVPNSTATPTTSTTTTLVPQATIDRVQQAEDDLARISEGIDEDTPLVEAAADFNAAALSLEIAWLNLLNDAGCLTDEQQAQAAEALGAYTTALQTDLTTAGYDPGPIDGVYGPKTVAAVQQLQKDSGLEETGFVDEATSRALQEKLAEVGQQQALQTAQVQRILSIVGFWDGPVDGVWTPELTQALMDFQTALGVEPTGVVDAATIAAFQQAIANLEPGGTPTTTGAPAPTVAPTRPPTATTAAPAPDDSTTLAVADSDLGQVLTSGSGMTVYLFIPDAQGAPTCTDACAQSWPPVVVNEGTEVTGGDGVDASLLGTADHPDAGRQATYNGWPLYVFSGDSRPGDTNGQGQGGVWYALDPAGNPIDDA